MKPAFNEEVMLAGWSETHNGGAKVTFWLADSESLEAFKAMTVAKGKTAGQRLAMCLVEIDDNEQPKLPFSRTPEAKKEPITGLALLAVQWCKEPLFWQWLSENKGDLIVGDEATAKSVVCYRCLINSRKELNTNHRAADLFNSNIRLPYMDFLSKHENINRKR